MNDFTKGRFFLSEDVHNQDGREKIAYALMGPSIVVDAETEMDPWYIARMESNSPNSKSNSDLFVTAGNAATKCAEMGYDGIACLELLPEAIDSMVVLVEYLEENTGEWDAQQVWAMRAIIEKARGKEAP